MSLTVRPAGPDDGPAVAEIRVRTWRTAYRGTVPQDVLDSMDPQREGEVWRRRIADPDNPFSTLVAENAGTVGGFVTTGPYRQDGDDLPAPAGAGEILAIYVHPDHWSTGMGRALMANALALLAGQGRRPVLLWVFRDNPRARRFYEKAGFAVDGTEHVYESGGVPIPEVRYRHDGI